MMISWNKAKLATTYFLALGFFGFLTASSIAQTLETDPQPAVFPTRPAAGQAGVGCFSVNSVKISGRHDLLKTDFLQKIVQPFLVSCQDNETVGGLLKTINSALAEEGFVTTQGYLPPQDIAGSRELLVNVVPGRVGEVRYEEDSGNAQWLVPRLFSKAKGATQAKNISEFRTRSDAFLEAIDDDFETVSLLPPAARMWAANSAEAGKILHVDDVQNVVDGFNRVPSGKAKAELSPGKEPATSNITIRNKPEDSFRAYAGYDTESIEGTGRLRFGTTIEKDNLIGLNDTWALTLRSGTSTNDVSGNASIPYRNFTLRTSGSWQESTTDLSGLAELFVTTWNVNTGIDWLVERTKSTKTLIDLTVGHREQNRYINGLKLQDQRVSTVQTGVSHTRSFERGSISSRVGITVGLPIFNASRDPIEIAADVPRAQFLKLEGNVGGSYVIPGVN